MKTATPRSKALLEGEGWTVAVVEHWNAYTQRRHDLLGMFDLIAFGESGVLACQPTTYSNVAARIAKITDSPHIAAVRKAGVRVEVHGWAKAKVVEDGRTKIKWVLKRRVDLS